MFNKQHLTLLFIVNLTITLISCHHQSVIIIGAGSSGIAAATRLLSHNITDITILEAEDRIGGRIHTAPCGDHHVVELGAEWLHGKGGNVVYEMMKEKDLLDRLSNGDFHPSILFSNGKSLDKDKSLEVIGILMDVLHNVDMEKDKGKTSGEHFVPAFTAAVNKQYHDDPEILAMILKTLPYTERVMEGLYGSFSWSDSSVASTYEEVEDERLGFYTTFKGKGYQQIFDIMSGKIPESATTLPLDDKIHLKKVVSKINYSGAKPMVTCADGSEYTADYVLFTPSVGVMKHEHESMFEPALPEDKVAAINDLGMDAIFKVVMHYNNPWWNKDSESNYHFVINEEDNKEIAEVFPEGPMKDGKSWLTGFFAFMTSEHNPNVAYGLFTGANVPEMENLSDKDLKKGINFILTKYFGAKHTLTKPDKMTKTDWYKNPHFRGVVSYETLKSQREDECVHMILAKPLKNTDGHEVVFFAGEATSMKHFATVHGAVESGYREAERMLKIHNDT